jgi:hypothetical protein
MKRTFSYPPPYQDAAVLCGNLGIDMETLDRRLARGAFPRPIKFGDIKLWRWADVGKSRIYFVECGGFIKIGLTSNPKQRLANLANTSGPALKPLLVIPGTRATELKLHKKFRHLHDHGEWFRAAPELLRYIEGLR